MPVSKRLGEGHMVVFQDAQRAVDAAVEAVSQLAMVDVDGDGARLRVGAHLGRPRKLGADYLGVDVNVAARVTEAARGGEVLVSGTALAALDTASTLTTMGRRRFRAKGAPRGLDVYVVAPSSVTTHPAVCGHRVEASAPPRDVAPLPLRR